MQQALSLHGSMALLTTGNKLLAWDVGGIVYLWRGKAIVSHVLNSVGVGIFTLVRET